MKKILVTTTTLFAVVTVSASAATIAAWHTFDTPGASPVSSQVSPPASITSTLSYELGAATAFDQAGASRGSNDLNYGTIAGAPNNAGVASDGVTSTVAAFIDFTITNGGSDSLELTSFNFDALRRFNGSINRFDIDVVAGSDITVGNVVTAQGLGPANGGNLPSDSDFNDFTRSLTGIADNTLASGESATLRFSIYHTSDPTPGPVFLDNIALEGNVIAVPEPSAFILSMLGMMSLIIRRR